MSKPIGSIRHVHDFSRSWWLPVDEAGRFIDILRFEPPTRVRYRRRCRVPGCGVWEEADDLVPAQFALPRSLWGRYRQPRVVGSFRRREK